MLSIKSLTIRTCRVAVLNINGIQNIQFGHLETVNHNQNRSFHHSAPRQNMLVIGGLGILTSAVVAQYSYQWYTSYQLKKAEELKNPPIKEEENNAKSQAYSESKEEKEEVKGTETNKKAKEEKNYSAPGWFDNWFAKRFYDGGFEDKMTKREAALILGVRETTPVSKVKDAHRRILMANHPDRGGSPFIASKVNEAKDLLTKGRE